MNTRIVEQELELELKKIEQLKKAMDIGFLLGQGKTAEEILTINRRRESDDASR